MSRIENLTACNFLEKVAELLEKIWLKKWGRFTDDDIYPFFYGKSVAFSEK